MARTDRRLSRRRGRSERARPVPSRRREQQSRRGVWPSSSLLPRARARVDEDGWRRDEDSGGWGEMEMRVTETRGFAWLIGLLRGWRCGAGFREKERESERARRMCGPAGPATLSRQVLCQPFERAAIVPAARDPDDRRRTQRRRERTARAPRLVGASRDSLSSRSPAASDSRARRTRAAEGCGRRTARA